MVKGIGVDIVEIKRISELIEKYRDQFLSRVFTTAEIAYCKARANPALHFSGRWAAKEAFYKALPSSCQPLSGWKSVQLLPGKPEDGKPWLEVCDTDLQNKMEREGVMSCSVSISHEKTLCMAFVVLEGR